MSPLLDTSAAFADHPRHVAPVALAAIDARSVLLTADRKAVEADAAVGADVELWIPDADGATSARDGDDRLQPVRECALFVPRCGHPARHSRTAECTVQGGDDPASVTGAGAYWGLTP